VKPIYLSDEEIGVEETDNEEVSETCKTALEKARKTTEGTITVLKTRSQAGLQGAEWMTSRRVVAVAPLEIERARTPRDGKRYHWGIYLDGTSLGARVAGTMSSGK
jgi:hypothetical protein